MHNVLAFLLLAIPCAHACRAALRYVNKPDRV